jgi:hypothetical protein
MSVEPALVDPVVVEAEPVDPIPVVSADVDPVVPAVPAGLDEAVALEDVPVVPTLNLPPSAWNSCQPAHAITSPPATPMSMKIVLIA